jgi:hypothetical protein
MSGMTTRWSVSICENKRTTGRHFIFPLDTHQKPLFEALGTKDPDKKHILYDGGHRNLVTRPDLLGEVLDWFDRYLGPVESVRATSPGR